MQMWDNRACKSTRWVPEVAIDGFGAFAAFSDGPYDERLTPSHVACGVDAWDTRAVGVGVRGYVSVSIEFDSRLFDKPLMHGTHESRCQQNEIGPDFKLASSDLLHLPATVVLAPIHVDTPQALDPPGCDLKRGSRHGPQPFAALIVGCCCS